LSNFLADLPRFMLNGYQSGAQNSSLDGGSVGGYSAGAEISGSHKQLESAPWTTVWERSRQRG